MWVNRCEHRHQSFLSCHVFFRLFSFLFLFGFWFLCLFRHIFFVILVYWSGRLRLRASKQRKQSCLALELLDGTHFVSIVIIYLTSGTWVDSRSARPLICPLINNTAAKTVLLLCFVFRMFYARDTRLSNFASHTPRGCDETFSGKPIIEWQLHFTPWVVWFKKKKEKTCMISGHLMISGHQRCTQRIASVFKQRAQSNL